MSPFDGSWMATLGGIVFMSILIAAAIGDVRTRRIPNGLVGSLALLGLASGVVAGPLSEGISRGGLGMIVGLACWLPFYALGWLGAGDVKLYAAAAAWLGPGRAVEGALIGALAGAVLSLVWMVKSRGFKRTVETLGMAAGSPAILSGQTGTSDGRFSSLPYGIAIAFGAICAGWMPERLFV